MSNMKNEALIAAGDTAVRKDIAEVFVAFREALELSIAEMRKDIFQLKQRVAKLEGASPSSD